MAPPKQVAARSSPKKPDFEQLQADHELFLQAFEKPTQIYRFLAARNKISPIFLHRTLSYLSKRCSRSNEGRKSFKSDGLLENNHSRKASSGTLCKVPGSSLQLTFQALRLPKGAEFQTEDASANVEIVLLKICHRRRKNVATPTNSIPLTNVGVPVLNHHDQEPSEAAPSQSVTLSSASLGLVNGHRSRTFLLLFRVRYPAIDQPSTAGSGFTLCNGDLKPSSGSPSPKRRRLSSNSSSPEKGTSTVGRDRLRRDHTTYFTELVLVDKQSRCQLTDGDYEVTLQEARPRSSHGKKASWETISSTPVKSSLNSSNSNPVLKFHLVWGQEDVAENGIAGNEENLDQTQTAHSILSRQSRSPGHASPGRMAASPARLQTSTGRLQTSPGRLQTSPGRLQTSPGRLQASPGRLQTSPGRLQDSPGQPHPSPVRTHTLPGGSHPSPVRQETPPARQHVSPARKHPSPARNESPARSLRNGDVGGDATSEPGGVPMRARALYRTTPTKESRPKRVYYQFLYNNNLRQQTEARDNLRCPWCTINCMELYGLLKHLTLSHSRFNFTLVPHIKGAWIDVTINEHYDGSYAGNPHNLTSYTGYAFRRNGPCRRTPVTQIIVARPQRTSQDLSEFQEGENKEYLTQRAIVSGHNRVYYHTHTLQPIRPQEMDEDSEAETDPEWMRQRTKMMIDEFTDVNEGEKEVMKMWNLHCMKKNYIADSQIPVCCMTFIAERGRELISRGLQRNFMLHLVNLYDFSLLPSQLICLIMAQLDRMEAQMTSNGPSVTSDDPSMTFDPPANSGMSYQAQCSSQGTLSLAGPSSSQASTSAAAPPRWLAQRVPTPSDTQQ